MCNCFTLRVGWVAINFFLQISCCVRFAKIVKIGWQRHCYEWKQSGPFWYITVFNQWIMYTVWRKQAKGGNWQKEQESRAIAKKPLDAAAVCCGLKFADTIHYKFKSSQALKARLQSSKHTGAKQNLTQNGHSRSFKVTCFGVSGKGLSNTIQ